MRFKKTTALVLVSIMALSLSACTNNTNKSQDSDPSSKGSSSKNTELSVSIWDSNQEPGIKQLLGDFTAKTGIKTKLSVVKWDEYWTMLEAGAQGGSLPDVFWMHSNESQRYMSNNMLLDLTSKIADSLEIEPANYPEDIWGLYTHEKKYYAVPKDIDTIALWYNKSMFDEANLPYPTADWTWDDFTNAAKSLTKEDKSQYGFAVKNDSGQAGYYNFVYGNNGYIINDDKTQSGWDEPKTIEGMQQLEKLIKLGVMPSLETMAENNEEVLLQSGQIAMALQGSWMISSYRDNDYTAKNCDVVELPQNASTGKRVSIYNGLGWAASASGKSTEEAWKLIEYLGSKEAQTKQSELGITMSAYKDTSDAWVKSSNFNLQAYLNMMDDMVIRPYSKSTVTWENKSNEILKSVYTGKKTMEEACKEMATQMNQQLADEK